MHCASCASIVQRQLQKAPGVEKCDVSLTWEQAQITGDETSLYPKKLNPFLAKFGYAVEELEESNTSSLDWKTIWLSVSAIATFIFMFVNLVSMQLFNGMLFPSDIGDVIFLILAVLNWSLTSSRFVKAIWTFMRTRVANMDTLIGIGTTVALISSILSVISSQFQSLIGTASHNYADVVVVVIGFVYLGQAIEKKLRAKTGASLRTLQDRLAKTIIVEVKNGVEERALSEVILGDIMHVGAGAVIPADGIIIEGASAINESALTGESMPVERQTGQRVLAGTLNTSGTLRVQVTALGKDTLYGKATESVINASREKASIERLTDRIASVFVPTILILALCVWAGWYFFGYLFVPTDESLRLAISSAIAVLVVACPCALGLATPTAVSATLGRFTKLGVFVRNTQVLETIGKIDTIIFDKTGTLTIGRPLVKKIITASNISQQELLSIVAGLETGSQHPLATAIQLYAEEQGITPKMLTNIETIQGKGIRGVLNKHTYLAGSPSFLKESKVQLTATQDKDAIGQIVVAKDSIFLGSIIFQDELRPQMLETVKTLRSQGLTCILLSGDDEKRTADIAKQTGISEWQSAYGPDEKVTFIQDLQAKKHKVLMIGDGINDTAALARANISMAVSSGSDTALSVADATIFSSALEKLPKIIQVGSFGMRIIHENLAWAFGYNLICIPLAAGILYPSWHLQLSPMIAGALMSFSSISVVANALRISKK